MIGKNVICHRIAIGGNDARNDQQKSPQEAENCLSHELVLPAYDCVLKCSHTFNLLDARGVISKDERTNYINSKSK